MGLLFKITLDGKVYRCKKCATHLGLVDDLFSKSYIGISGNGISGRGYLFAKVVNITVGEKEEMMLCSRKRPKMEKYTVDDIFCAGCNKMVGWIYEIAHCKCQKYEEGNFILERSMLEVEYTNTGRIAEFSDT